MLFKVNLYFETVVDTAADDYDEIKLTSEMLRCDTLGECSRFAEMLAEKTGASGFDFEVFNEPEEIHFR